MIYKNSDISSNDQLANASTKPWPFPHQQLETLRVKIIVLPWNPILGDIIKKIDG